MNGSDGSPRILDLSRSQMYTTARMSDDEQEDCFGTPNVSYVSRIDTDIEPPNHNGAKPRISMYSMKLFDPLMASPAPGQSQSQQQPYNGNGVTSPQVNHVTVTNNSPLVSLSTPMATNGNTSHKSSPGSTPVKTSPNSSAVPSSRLSEAIVESLKNQELQFQEQLISKDEEIEQLKNQLSSAYEVICTLKVAHEDLMDVATRAIEKEREEKDALRNKIKSMFNEI